MLSRSVHPGFSEVWGEKSLPADGFSFNTIGWLSCRHSYALLPMPQSTGFYVLCGHFHLTPALLEICCPHCFFQEVNFKGLEVKLKKTRLVQILRKEYDLQRIQRT